MLHIPHIFTRHCKAFIWVWVFRRMRRGRFAGPQGKTVVLSMCHRILYIMAGARETLWESRHHLVAHATRAPFTYAEAVLINKLSTWLVSICFRVSAK